MNNKLEEILKVEIPYMYLPHRLHVLENSATQPIEVIGIRWNDTEEDPHHEYQVYNEYEDEYIDVRKCKPVLRSLKKLTIKELEYIGQIANDDSISSLLNLGENFLRGGCGRVLTLEKIIKITEYLYSVLADVNGLIEQGLAVDSNKLD